MNSHDKDLENLQEKYHHKITKINLFWVIGILVGIIVLLITYKIWGNKGSTENLISIGTGILSIFLSVFAIVYSFTENIKTNNRENKVDYILDKINDCVNKLNKKFIKLQSSLEEIKNEYETFPKDGKEYNEAINETYPVTGHNQDLNENKIRHFSTNDAAMDSHECGNNAEQKSKSNETVQFSVIESSNNLHDNKITPCRGEIYFANMKACTRTSSGNRPVIIIQNNIANNYMNLITVVPVTSRVFSNSLPTHIQFNLLEKPATILVENMLSISKSCLKYKIGKLKESEMVLINEAIKIQLSIE